MIARAVLLLVFALASGAVAMDTRSPAPGVFVLGGRVEGASDNHVVFIALWQAAGFLHRPVQQLRIEPGRPVAFRFQVPRGAWALSAFEDVNGNGELDMGIFGPKEPSGFWRKFTGWHRPDFDEVSMMVERDIENAVIALK
jgi:uncharacterized protein (DUF2141 family)